MDLNQGPSGYEPDELPDCSIPRYYVFSLSSFKLWPITALLSTCLIYQHLCRLRNPVAELILKGSLKLRKPCDRGVWFWDASLLCADYNACSYKG